MNRSSVVTSFYILFTAMFLLSCEDTGNPVTPLPSAPAHTLSSIVPDSAAVGDTVTIVGKKFGATQGSGAVLFGSVAATAIVSWNDSTIRAAVPTGAVTGTVTVRVNGTTSSGLPFKVLSTVSAVSFSADILPLINSYNCASCHPGNGGFSVANYSAILAGGSRGNTVVPNNAAASFLIKKLQGTLSGGEGARMPQGGPYMTTAEIQKFIDWINQGAQNN